MEFEIVKFKYLSLKISNSVKSYLSCEIFIYPFLISAISFCTYMKAKTSNFKYDCFYIEDEIIFYIQIAFVSIFLMHRKNKILVIYLHQIIKIFVNILPQYSFFQVSIQLNINFICFFSLKNIGIHFIKIKFWVDNLERRMVEKKYCQTNLFV